MLKEQYEKENHILDAAISIFAERGFHSTTIEMIAEAAAVGKGTVYLYFSSKEELLAKLIYRAMNGQVHEAKAALELDDAYERLRGVLAAGKLFLSKNADLANVFAVESINVLRNDKFRERVYDLYTKYLGLVVEAIKMGQRDGKFREALCPETIGRLLVSLRTGMLLELIRSHMTDVPESMISDAMDFILNGISVL